MRVSLSFTRRLRPPLLILLAAAATCIVLPVWSKDVEEVRCDSVNIRNNPLDHWKYRNCTVVEGMMLIALITKASHGYDDYPVFYQLTEITDYLVLFNINYNVSLSRMFPALRVIGGRQLVSNYALVVFQNEHLPDVALPSLRVIRNGGVRIAQNKRLCYARSIDWAAMLMGPVDDVRVEDGTFDTGKRHGTGDVTGPAIQCDDQCEVEERSACRHIGPDIVSCWNSTTCQPECVHDRLANGTAGPGCVDGSSHLRCHSECLGGCWRADDPSACHVCANVRYKGKCEPTCPSDLFAYMGRRCMTKKECLELSDYNPPSEPAVFRKWKAFGGQCHYQCPEGYQEDKANPSACAKCDDVMACPRICKGKNIESLADALKLSECSVIEGQLQISLRSGLDRASGDKLTKAFGKIQVIDGNLVIRLSPVLVSLHVFKSLKNITGSTLKDGNALVVMENESLRELFAPDQNLAIGKGNVQFSNNRMLCYGKILSFMKKIGRPPPDETMMGSNGDKAICEESTFEVKGEAMTGMSGFVLTWPPVNITDMDYRKFLGYQVFYMEVDHEDPKMSVNDNRSACFDQWRVDFVEADEDAHTNDDFMHLKNNSAPTTTARPKLKKMVEHGIMHNRIKPNTLYAYYVETKVVLHEGARNAVSKIGFVRTLFAPPSEPDITAAVAVAPDSISVSWNPPTRPNGVVSYYRITWQRRKDIVDGARRKVCDGLLAFSGGSASGSAGGPPTATPSSAMAAAAAEAAEKEGQCSAVPGCCVCGSATVDEDDLTDEDELDQVSEESDFENKLQNTVFVQRKSRHRRDLKGNKDKDVVGGASKMKKLLTSTRPTTSALSTTVLPPPGPDEMGTVNVTAGELLGYTITGLRHFSNYEIYVEACQDNNAPQWFCSNAYESVAKHRFVRTQLKPDYDMVPSDSIVVSLVNGTGSDLKVEWQPPEQTNGPVLGYWVTVQNRATQSTGIPQCVEAEDGDENKVLEMVFSGIADGDYSVEIKTMTLAQTSEPATTKELFTIYNPGFFTLRNILILGLGIIVLFVFAALIIWHCVNRYYGKRVGEYIRQTISANPEYLSQMDVYKQDEWELSRAELTLEEEIGRGTFGKVFRGRGHNVRSQCGEVFGICAVKTVTETANSAERLHFLIEASVMKTFNTSFIVKLYGVVSDGQPVLVVMEMMEKGNLRDYLRSRRPDAEENVDGLPPPSAQQYVEWACQIADGMAYLESLKFCHRDLAARNCMVAGNDDVKIGDFGMARDIYYHEYYKPTGKRLMPVRWMAPESLRDGKFTMKSDVWSYGIVLYEMLTLAQQPYQGLANDQVFNFIGVSRKILDKPMDCPDFWYDLMVSCWRYVPKERPSFRQIVEHLMPHSTARFHSMSFVCHSEAAPEKASANGGGSERGGAAGGDGYDPPYVPEGHGMRRISSQHDVEDGLCQSNRAVNELAGWNGEGDGFPVDREMAEDEV